MIEENLCVTGNVMLVLPALKSDCFVCDLCVTCEFPQKTRAAWNLWLFMAWKDRLAIVFPSCLLPVESKIVGRGSVDREVPAGP